MPNENQTGNAKGKRGEIVYSGQYVQVARASGGYLLACARKVPDSNEGEYLLNMVNELRDVYDKVTRNGELGDIYVDAVVEFNSILHQITVGKGGKVHVEPVKVPAVGKDIWPIIFADNVELEAADGGKVIYHGQYVDVAEGEDGMLRAYPRRDVGLGPFKLMEAALGEVKRKFRTLTKGRANKAVEIWGLVWQKGVAHRLVVRGRDDVGFKLMRGDYADVAKGAELVLFPMLFC